MQDEIPTAKFKELLARFMEEKLLSDQSVDMAYNHFFRKGPLPFFTLTELYDTVVYLKDVMDTNHLTTLDDVLDYYERKKRAVRGYIDSILDTPKGSQSISRKRYLKPGQSRQTGRNRRITLPIDEGYGFPCCIHPGCLLPMPRDRSMVDLSPLKKGAKRKPLDN